MALGWAFRIAFFALIAAAVRPAFGQPLPAIERHAGDYALATDSPPPARRLPPPPQRGPLPADPGAERTETLEEAWAQALAADQRLEAKRWETYSATESLHAACAQYLPSVGLENSYTVRSAEPGFVIQLPGTLLDDTAFPYLQRENYALRARADVPVYASGRIRYGVAAADAERTSVAWDEAGFRNDLMLRVAEEYVAVLRASRGLDVARSSVASLGGHLQDATRRFEQALVPRNDLLAAEVALANARQSALQAENLLDAAKAAYNRRLGRRLDASVRLAEISLGSVDEPLEELTARALRQRPDRARLIAQATALRHQARSLRAKNQPQVDVRGEYSFQENRFQSPDGVASASVALGWNVFDGGRVRHEAASLQGRAESAARILADLESSIALEVRRAWLDVRETRQRLDVTGESLDHAEENLRVARARYASGVGTSTEVLDAETLRATSYRNHNHALLDAALAVLRLEHAAADLI